MSTNGLYFEDFTVGQVFTSPARTITETDIVMFAALSGDYNAMHTDAAYAQTTPFGERIAHGVLGLAIANGLKWRLGLTDGTALAFMSMTWKFSGAIKIGDTIHVRMRVGDLKPTSKPDRGILVQVVEVVNQDGQVVQEGEQVVLMKRRPVREQEGGRGS